MYIADCVYIPIVGLKMVDLGLASDFFHAVGYTAYADRSMKYLCSFRTLTPYQQQCLKFTVMTDIVFLTFVKEYR